MNDTATVPLSNERQAELGQFLTNPFVAEFMASMFARPERDNIRLLDAGAGAGALTAAFIARACSEFKNVRAIHATVYEIDLAILPALNATLDACTRKCAAAKIRFTHDVRVENFISDVAPRVSRDLFASPVPYFDFAIANPPYRKIAAASAERQSLSAAGIETSNLYTGFIALIYRCLNQSGQLVAITPRSFCNGPYFRPFREDLLNSVSLHRLHVFDSRKAAFREDGVLQENIIFHASRGERQRAQIIISSSSGERDASVTETEMPFTEIVQPDDPARVIHIPSRSEHSVARAALGSFEHTLASLGLSVSTGRVVDFRVKDSLRRVPELGTVPLIYPGHFNGGTVHWPKPEGKKPNALVLQKVTEPLLVPNGIYVLTKRFTSKEERRRLVACFLDPTQIDADRIGLENHLNYFHSNGRGIERDLAAGLFVFLNSTIVDQYFRRFSGHTQVNATDLRMLTYPSAATLRTLGRSLKDFAASQESIDQLMSAHLHAPA